MHTHLPSKPTKELARYMNSINLELGRFIVIMNPMIRDGDQLNPVPMS